MKILGKISLIIGLIALAIAIIEFNSEGFSNTCGTWGVIGLLGLAFSFWCYKGNSCPKCGKAHHRKEELDRHHRNTRTKIEKENDKEVWYHIDVFEVTYRCLECGEQYTTTEEEKHRIN